MKLYEHFKGQGTGGNQSFLKNEFIAITKIKVVSSPTVTALNINLVDSFDTSVASASPEILLRDFFRLYVNGLKNAEKSRRQLYHY